MRLANYTKIFKKNGLMIVAGIFTILSISFFLFIPFTNTTSRIINGRTFDSLETSSKMFSHIHLWSMPKFISLEKNKPILEFIYSKEPSNIVALRALEEIDKIILENDFLHSVYIYSETNGIISTLSGWERGELSDNTIDKLVNNNIDEATHVFRPRQVNFFNNKENTNIYSMILGKRVDNNKTTSCIIINLSVSKISEIIAPMDMNITSDLVIIDRNNKILLHPDKTMFGNSLDSTSDFYNISQMKAEEGSIETIINGGKSVVWWLDHNELPWRFILYSPKNDLYHEIIQLRKILILLSLGGSIVFIILFILAYNKITFTRNIEESIKRVIDYYPDHDLEDDFLVMSALDKKNSKWTIALIGLEKNTSKDISFDSGLNTIYFIRCNTNKFCLISLLSTKKMVEYLQEKQSSESIKNNGLSFSFCISSFTTNTDSFMSQYTLLNSSFSRKFKFERNSQIPLLDQNEKLSSSFEINENEINHLDSAIRLENAKEAWKIITELLDLCDKDGSEEAFHYVINIIRYRLFQNSILNPETIVIEGINNLNDAITDIETIPEARELFEKYCNRLQSIKTGRTDLKKVEIHKKVKEFVEDNLCNLNLGPDLISEEVGRSSGYVRDTFRSIEGDSLSNYIGSKRIEFAKDLLLKTNKPIKDIAEASGFMNYSYFFTYFKKITGKTPGDFRISQ
ncbi:AraC family transcriptional regulator [Thiospirochaeta perfilievii]|uniref:AraC family transcriptional regulator n=1 Tax=Thiospirochaeta perfilievii TaxID=252967 RepID=A0A5C1QE32_9SPIO|nr:helix-turn-helix domain-containing protein [Thiospirochaeta perfilievii]QEN04462.1 AraC family transcriptional regulator [Thiospirochaeta perfilievii]